MVSRLFGSNPFDDLVDRATSEYLPAGQSDLALNLDVCDLVRSKQVPAKQALATLKRRIGHRNPNVQILALNLTDACVKNGGHHFLVEVASRDFMDFLLVLITQQSGTSPDVRIRVMQLLQIWALAFKSKKDLSYVSEIYEQLKHEGYTFPPITDKVEPIMIDTLTPPEWSDSQVCMRCRIPFTFTNRKHHCRNCGETFCQQCSSHVAPLPHMGIHQQVRVCTNCHTMLKKSGQPTAAMKNPSLNGTANMWDKASPNASRKSVQFKDGVTAINGKRNSSLPRNDAASEEEDDDLKLAIQLSLKETQQKPHKPNIVNQSKAIEKEEVDDDPDLAAAIAASLKDVGKRPVRNRIPSPSPPPSRYQAKLPAPEPMEEEFDEDLTIDEAENIVLFATLVDRLCDTGNSVTGDRQLRQLRDQIGALLPKLIKGLEESAKKHRAYVELHEKLTTAQRLYDGMITEQQALRSNRLYNLQRQPSTSSTLLHQPVTPAMIRNEHTHQYYQPPLPPPHAHAPNNYPVNEYPSTAAAMGSFVPYPVGMTNGTQPSAPTAPTTTTTWSVPPSYPMYPAQYPPTQPQQVYTPSANEQPSPYALTEPQQQFSQHPYLQSQQQQQPPPPPPPPSALIQQPPSQPPLNQQQYLPNQLQQPLNQQQQQWEQPQQQQQLQQPRNPFPPTTPQTVPVDGSNGMEGRTMEKPQHRHTISSPSFNVQSPNVHAPPLAQIMTNGQLQERQNSSLIDL